MNDERLRYWTAEFEALGLFRVREIGPPEGAADVDEIHQAAADVGVCVYGAADHGFTVHSKI